MHGRLVAALFLASLALCATARAEDRHLVILGGGFYDLELPTDAVDRAAVYNLELRLRPGLWHFHPHGGFQGTSDGSVYGFAGVHLDFPIGEHLRLVPSGSLGLYGQGENDKDLGGLLQFRIGGGLAWSFENDWRLGLTWYHMSNAGIYDDNPGVEMMSLELGIPLP